jgi:Protein of unknown function (DUF3606)
MDTQIKTASRNKEITNIQENYEVDYWSKKYGVSTEELKKTGHTDSIRAKIVEAQFKNKNSNI